MSPKQYAAYLRQQKKVVPERAYMPRFRRMCFKVLELTLQNTPVNFGDLRNSWHLTIGQPSATDVEAGKSPAGVLQAAERVLNRMVLGDGVYMQNNKPYARVWEDGLFVPPNPGPSKATHVPKSRRKTVEGTVLVRGGFNVVAPNGMLRDAVQQVQALVAAGAL